MNRKISSLDTNSKVKSLSGSDFGYGMGLSFGPIIRKEKIFNGLGYSMVTHSDYFIDFIKEEFGEITFNLNFKSCLSIYEMYKDVSNVLTRNNFKRRFRMEKRKLQGFSN